jgi:hypothetical protein
MNPTDILMPSIAMALLTLALLVYMGLSRFRAVRRREVNPKFYRSYREGEQPERLHVLGRHVQNHFEVPPLFHVVVLATYVTGLVDPLGVSLAWAFFGLRCVHTFVHLGTNNVLRRFTVFGLSVVMLAALWVRLLLGLLDAAS